MKKLLCLSVAVIIVSTMCLNIFITVGAAEEWLWPIEGYYNISSGYGKRSMGHHQGIDIDGYGVGNITGAPVRAARSGYATVYPNNPSAGNYVAIDHGDGYVSRYLHMESLAISSGAVSQGQIVGYAGNTGDSTGPHLHFDIKLNGKEINPMPVNSTIKHSYQGSSAAFTENIKYKYSQVTNSNPNSSAISNTNQVLRYGANSYSVIELQNALNAIMGSGLVVDGKYGNATQNAVKSFQTKYGLAVDGEAGPKTLGKINELLIHKCNYSSIGYESVHPHKVYGACACGKTQYTGETKKLDSCETCNPPSCNHEITRLLVEEKHPHREYKECAVCNEFLSYTNNNVKNENCDECHSHKFNRKYDDEHPHKEYIYCECGVKEETGLTEKREGCSQCYGNTKVLKLQIGIPSMMVNDAQMEIDPGRGTVPILKDSRTLLPIRAIAENFNAYVIWNEVEEKVIIYGNVVIELWLNKTDALVNGELYKLDVAPITVNDRTYMPLRFIAEQMGLTVGWNELNQTITITGNI